MYRKSWVYKNVYLKQIRKKSLNNYLKQIKEGTKPLYIHINKTAGSSIAKSLGITEAHFTLSEYEKLFKDKFQVLLPADTEIWCSIRNPFDKVVSEYFYRIKTNQNRMRTNPIKFNDWVYFTYDVKHPFYRDREIMFNSQLKWISSQNKYHINIIRFESLYNDYNKLVSNKKFAVGKLTWKKKSNHQLYSQYYSSDSRKIIEREFAEDIEKFNYFF
jgi:hypothetical protein